MDAPNQDEAWAVFRDQLRYWRDRASLTRRALAELIGTTAKRVENWELGYSKPPVDVVRDLDDQYVVRCPEYRRYHLHELDPRTASAELARYDELRRERRGPAAENPLRACSWVWRYVDRHLAWLVPTNGMALVAGRVADHPLTVVVAGSGGGKSALATALVVPEVTDGAVPGDLCHALTVLHGNLQLRTFFSGLARQLEYTLPGFISVYNMLRFSRAPSGWADAATEVEILTEALAGIDRSEPVGLVFDGFEHVGSSEERMQVGRIIDEVVATERFRVVVTSVPGSSQWLDGHRIDHVYLPRPEPHVLHRYLERRGVTDRQAAARIVAAARSNWIFCAKLAENHLTRADEEAVQPTTVDELWQEMLAPLRVGTEADWLDARRALAVLAVAGVDTPMPVSILHRAAKNLGYGSEQSHFVAMLRNIRQIWVMQVGSRELGLDQLAAQLEHASLREFLIRALDAEGPSLMRPLRSVDVRVQLLAALRTESTLANGNRIAAASPIYRYAQAIEPELLWRLGRPRDAIYAAGVELKGTREPGPSLLYWQAWRARVSAALEDEGSGDLRAELEEAELYCRVSVGFWVGRTGNYDEARRICRSVVEDGTTRLGALHRVVVEARGNLAFYDYKQSLDPFSRQGIEQAIVADRSLLADIEAGGFDHRELHIRAQLRIGKYEARLDPAAALELLRRALADAEENLLEHNLLTFEARAAVATQLGRNGDVAEATVAYSQLVQDAERLLGSDHAQTLLTRRRHAFWTAKNGDPQRAFELMRPLLPRFAAAFGHDHHHTLKTRHLMDGIRGTRAS